MGMPGKINASCWGIYALLEETVDVLLDGLRDMINYDWLCGRDLASLCIPQHAAMRCFKEKAGTLMARLTNSESHTPVRADDRHVPTIRFRGEFSDAD